MITADDVALRQFNRNDLEPIYTLIKKERLFLAEFIPWIKTVHSVQDLGWLQNGPYFVIVYDGKAVGMCSCFFIDIYTEKTEIGFWISREYQNMGIVTRACQKLIEYCRNVLKMRRIELKTDIGNAGAIRVAEKLSFSREGTLKSASRRNEKVQDAYLYALIL